MKPDSIQDLKAFEERIYDAIQEYLDNREAYSKDAVLGICNKTKEIVIDNKANINAKFDKYELSTLIRKNEQGSDEPDGDSIYELACGYYFVR